jgi:transposase, IS5 family
MASHKRYEFGQKVSVTTTNRGNWIVGIDLCKGNPYDGHTLARAIATTERVTSVPVTNAFVDKGYRGHDYQGEATIHLAGRQRSPFDTNSKAAPQTTQCRGKSTTNAMRRN